MKKESRTIYTIIAIVFHIALPVILIGILIEYLTPLGYLKGAFVSFVILITLVVNIKLIKKSFYETKPNVHALAFVFGSYIGRLRTGLGYIPLGWRGEAIQEYIKTAILVKKTIIVDKLKENTEIIDYQMTVKLIFNLSIIDPEKFYLKTGLKEFNQSSITIKSFLENDDDTNKRKEVNTKISDQELALTRVIEDLASTFDSIAAHMGFDEFKLRTDWTITSLVAYAKNNSKIVGDTLVETLKEYGLPVDFTISTYCHLDEKTFQAQTELVVAEAQRQTDVYKATTANAVSAMRAKQEAENILIKANADVKSELLFADAISKKLEIVRSKLEESPSYKAMDEKYKSNFLATMLGKANIQIKQFGIEGFDSKSFVDTVLGAIAELNKK